MNSDQNKLIQGQLGPPAPLSALLKHAGKPSRRVTIATGDNTTGISSPCDSCSRRNLEDVSYRHLLSDSIFSVSNRGQGNVGHIVQVAKRGAPAVTSCW